MGLMKIDGITNKNKVNVCQTFCEKSIFDDFSLRNGLWKVREETRKDCNTQSVESRAK